MSLNKRECGSCTKCCEGWLPGGAYGKKFFPGRPCHYFKKTKNSGCSIYQNRPEDPCKKFECAWLKDSKIFPEWLKPELSNVIITNQEKNGINYFEFRNCGIELPVEILDWIIWFVGTYQVNVTYNIKGHWRSIGEENFTKLKFD